MKVVEAAFEGRCAAKQSEYHFMFAHYTIRYFQKDIQF